MRWVALVGRVGTVLLAVGLALVLASLIPPVRSIVTALEEPLPPEKCRVVHSGVLVPPMSLLVSAKSDGNVRLCILSVSGGQLVALVGKRFPELGEKVLWEAFGVTVLEEVLRARPEAVLWKSPLGRELFYEFSPAGILNITIIIANPSPELVLARVDVTQELEFAPGERVAAPAQWLSALGLLLATPWVILSRLRRE